MTRQPPVPPADDDDAALFRSAVGPVRDIGEQSEPPAKPRPRPRAAMGERDEAQARSEFRLALDEQLLGAGDALSYRRDEVPARVLKRLARGEYASGDELDLHGIDARTAENWLREFLRHAIGAGSGCVRIVHGKGLRSGTRGPVLKNAVNVILRRTDAVTAFCSARQVDGGTGAIYVLLAG